MRDSSKLIKKSCKDCNRIFTISRNYLTMSFDNDMTCKKTYLCDECIVAKKTGETITKKTPIKERGFNFLYKGTE